MADIYLAISETPTVVTLTSAVLNSAVASSVTVVNTVTVALDANSLSALENVTVTVGAAITGTVTVGNSVTIGSLPAISGTVTANLNLPSFAGANGAIVNTAVLIGYFDDGTSEFRKVDSAENPLPISGNVQIVAAIPAGTNQIGCVTASISNSVTIASLPAISGTVTANTAYATSVTGTARGGVVTAMPVALVDSGVYGGSIMYYDGSNTSLNINVKGSLPSLVAGTAQIGSVTASISNSVTIASLPAISGTVTANLSISATAITSGSFASLTSATLVPGNVARKMATVYNLGAGQLFVNAGSSASTLGGGFMVALSSGDFYECNYTTTTLSAIFATAGTASWVSH